MKPLAEGVAQAQGEQLRRYAATHSSKSQLYAAKAGPHHGHRSTVHDAVRDALQREFYTVSLQRRTLVVASGLGTVAAL